MKRFTIIAVFLFACAGTMHSQPKLSLEQPEIDLGIIYGSSVKKGRIGLKNIGTEPLRILNVQPGCGCTAVKRPKQELQPGESDDIEIEFNATGYRGRVQKDLYITTSDPTTQYVSVKIVADVREELEPTSHSSLIWLGNIPIGETASQLVTFRNVTPRVLTIRSAGSSLPNVSIDMDKKIVNPNDSVQVKISVRAEKAYYANERFWIDTDSKNQPRIEMRVSFLGIKP